MAVRQPPRGQGTHDTSIIGDAVGAGIGVAIGDAMDARQSRIPQQDCRAGSPGAHDRLGS